MITREQVGALYGRDVQDRDGDRIGSIGQIWADAAGQPSWASVRTGLFGLRESLVPLNDAELTGEHLTVAYDKAHVKDAPHIDAAYDEPLTQDEVDQLYQHYRMSPDTDAGDAAGAASRETPESATGDAMTRSEERLTVGTAREQVGRARLRKYVVTEYQQVTIPVQREEVRLEREPIAERDRGAAVGDPQLSESEHEIVLHAERPVVGTETVPIERVRLSKETVTESETVGGDIRKERIHTDLPGHDRRPV